MESTLWIIVPCYNEEEMIEETAQVLTKKLHELREKKRISKESRILFVDDGSKDKTWSLISEIHDRGEDVIGIKLSHNSGHQKALLAGMMYAKDKSDCVITMDADLQDDIELLEKFMISYEEGNQIVYGVRKKREKDSWLKRSSAQAFYQLMNLMGVEIIYNHADYRLMSRKALEALEEYQEVNLFLRGIIPQIGLKHEILYYDRAERQAGESKYPLHKMIEFAFDGITSFTVKPLRIISFMGILCSICSIAGLLYALISYFWGDTVPGWTAIVCSIWLLGGIQLLAIGVLGEYVGKIFGEVKKRPRYYIEEEIR